MLKIRKHDLKQISCVLFIVLIVVFMCGHSAYSNDKGYKLFFDGERVGYEPEWSFEKAIENLLWNRTKYSEKEVEAWYNDTKIETSGKGYELYFDYKRVGHEPEWSFEQAVENLIGNKNKYSQKDVQGFYQSHKIDISGRGYELFFDNKRVGHEPDWSLEEAIKNLKGNKERYPKKKVIGFYKGKRMQ